MGLRMIQVVRAACLVIAVAGFALVASADDWKKGRAPVDSVDSGARTIMLDDEIYQVPISCRIQRASGIRVLLSELRGGVRPGVMGVPTDEVDYVYYEAIKKRNGWEMVDMTVLERMPE